MAKADISVYGKRYLIACENGQENHLRQLAVKFDERVQDMAGVLGEIGSERLFIAAAISFIHELDETSKTAPIDAGAAQLDAAPETTVIETPAIDPAAIDALKQAAERINQLAQRIGDSV